MSPEILNIMQRSVDAIEDRLRTEVSLQELAAEAGFSPDHFGHVFKAVTGMSVGRWITRRRLLHAVWAMSRGMSAIDAALMWGFDTHAGFYKAFRKEFGCTPSAWKRTHRAVCPARVNLMEETKMMDMKLLARAMKAWGRTETPTPVYYANTGNRSETTFAVGDDHYVKFSSRPGEMARQAALQRALMGQGLAAPIVLTAAGEIVHHAEGYDFLLIEKQQGAPVGCMTVLQNPAAARAVGEGLARLHLALQTCDPLLCQQEDYAATLRDWAIPTARSVLTDTAWLEDFAARVEATFPALPVQIIHRDPNPDNMLMADGRVTGFLDFDLSRIMPRIFDLCYAATGVLCDAFLHVDKAECAGFFDAAKAIWQGYDSVSPLTGAEKSALPDMVLAIQLTCVAAFAGSDKWAKLLETNCAMLALIRDGLDKLAL